MGVVEDYDREVAKAKRQALEKPGKEVKFILFYFILFFDRIVKFEVKDMNVLIGNIKSIT